MHLKKILLGCNLVIASLALTAPVHAAKSEATTTKKVKEHEHPKHHDHLISLKTAISSYFPREQIEIRILKNSLILSGAVSSLEVADKAEKLAREFVGENTNLLNFMKIRGAQQVMLRVRVGEVQREDLRQFDSSSTSFNFDHMQRQGMVRMLAEPNLVAMSGERAEFLAGGEFPVPTVQKGGSIAVEYKSYGVKVGFTPLVLAPNRIRLSVEPEVSEINKNNPVAVEGYNIPSVTSRRAKTTVELAPGESFMIAGLIKDDYKTKRSGTELVISVTPYLVDPMENKDLKLPADLGRVASPLEKKFVNKLKTNLGKANVDGTSLEGPIGFIAE
jgi:pilus assembly protein CpaC